MIEDLWFCQDCTHYIANGELPPDNTPEEDHFIINGEALYEAEGYYLVLKDDSDEFMANTCDCCRSDLAGYRHEGAALKFKGE